MVLSTSYSCRAEGGKRMNKIQKRDEIQAAKINYVYHKKQMEYFQVKLIILKRK